VEWGISLLQNKLPSLLPKKFLWRLTLANSFIIIAFILISGWSIYEAACQIFDEMAMYQETKLFKTVLLQYLWIFVGIFIVLAIVIQYYFTRKLMKPLTELIESMKSLKQGHKVQNIQFQSDGEMEELIYHFNELVNQLECNKIQRHKQLTDFSHEFRTPLTNLNGYLKALQSGVITGDQELFHALQRESNRLISMLEQLKSIEEFEYVQNQKFVQKQEVQITEIINQVVKMFTWTLKGKNIDFTSDIDEQSIQINPTGMTQVISNLIDNAIRYYDGIYPIQITGKRKDESYCISVSGQGQFISKNEQDFIFERFYRTESTNKTIGKGLGLAISKEIVEQHDGNIRIMSDGYNHTFIVTIPISSKKVKRIDASFLENLN